MDFPEIYQRLHHYNSNEKITIRNQETSVLINKSLAIALSPNVFLALQENPSLKEITIPIKGNLERYFKGDIIDIEQFLKISTFLDMNIMIKKWKQSQNFSKRENVLKQLIFLIKYNGRIENMVEEMEMIGKNIEKFIGMKEFEKIPNFYLCEIMKRVKGIKSENEIFNYIVKKLEQENDQNIRINLINSIEMRGLNYENVQKLLKYLKFEDFSQSLFLSLKTKILKSLHILNISIIFENFYHLNLSFRYN